MTIRIILGMALMAFGILAASVAVFGVFRFRYVLNRMHAAALIDSLSLLSVLGGLVLMLGFQWQSAKIAVILIFVWFASPVMSHLIARAEIMTHPHIHDVCEVQSDDCDDI